MHLFQSNRLENLFEALCATLAEPLGNPLAPEIIVVQNPGMARWLSQQIALRTGISANFSFPLPASFIWQIFERTLGHLPDLSLFDRNVLLWRVQNELDTLLNDPGMAEINNYLTDDDDGRKRFQLAEKISDLLDQYQVYRPAMLLHWEQGGEEHWQARLWRRLTAKSRQHRAALLQRFVRAAELGELRRAQLPERVSLFGINSLAPAYLEVIERISAFVDVRLFHLSPCQQAWDDILSERLLALKRQSWRERGLDDLSAYFTAGNPLLASMGTVGQEFFSLLMGNDPQEIQLYQEPEGGSVLHRIQRDILHLHDRGGQRDSSVQGRTPLSPEDSSLRFHCCHSPMREVQVLHDRLLDLFAADPGLKPADILVMAPDITSYAPAVAGIFGSAPSARRIPWSIADQASRQEQPVIEGFLALLELQESRFTAPDIMALLENQAVLRRFGLAAEDVVFMRSAVLEAGVRWGLDQEHRCEQGLRNAQQHTWDFGLDRLLLGYLTGSLDEPWQGIMPGSGTVSGMGSWLGGLTGFIRAVQELRRRMKGRYRPERWAELLLSMIDEFLGGDGEHQGSQDGLLILRRSIADFVEHCHLAGFEQELSLPIIRHWLETRLSEPAGGQAFLAGRVTFCNMVPMRSVPFQVIWLLGMNDLDYPRSQRTPAFDLMARQPRLGDRSRRDDDRYLFLEALLSARNHLAVSWVGRDKQDNSLLPPSVVVAELRDYINRGWSADRKGEGEQAAAELLTVEHPLQPFSRQCFSGNTKTASYASEWLPRPLSSAAPVLAFFQDPLPQSEPCQQLDLNRLVRFWNHPVRFFLEQRMGLRSRYEEELLPETEAFALDHLQKYLLSREIMSRQYIERNVAEQQAATPLYRMQAAGHLPGGRFGHILYREMERNTAVLADALEPITQERVEPEEVQMTVDNFLLVGQLSSLYRSGRVTFRPATLKAGDILQLWIHHLVLLLRSPVAVRPVSVHAALDTTVCFREVEEPESELAALLRFFQQGEREPLHFYPKTSYAWAKARSEAAAWNAARKAWYTGFYRGEEDDPAYEIALRAQEPLDQRFVELAELFRPVVACMKKYKEDRVAPGC